jgi:hypothetical protein
MGLCCWGFQGKVRGKEVIAVRCRRKVKANMAKMWQKVYDQNYHKSLDHRSFYFKQVSLGPQPGEGSFARHPTIPPDNMLAWNPCNA